MATSFATCPYNEDPQYGLRWGKDTFSLIPTWTIEPIIEFIIQTLQARISCNKTYHVKRWRNGPYNKFYLVTYEGIHCYEDHIANMPKLQDREWYCHPNMEHRTAYTKFQVLRVVL